MAKFNKTEDYSFAKLCSAFISFEIPNFQRPYAWTNKNLQDFWSSIIQNDENYFMGNIVAVDTKPLKIVDGQQRLTTISLMLCAIRDSYLELNPKSNHDKQLVKQRSEDINKYLIWADLDPVPSIVRKRLLLGKDAYQNIFDKIIDKKLDDLNLKKLGDNEKRILNNYKILKSLIEKYIENSEISRLDEIKNKVLKLQFIIIVCDTDNDIYGIFEGFNSTGLGLSVADLVKTSILKATQGNEEIQANIENQWNELEELFEETSISKFPKFLRHQWISENGPIPMSNLYKKIKAEKIDGRSINDIEKYADNILNDGKIYIGMIYDKKTKLLDLPESVKNQIIEFRYLRNDQVYEVLLSWYKAYRNKRIKQSVFEKNLSKLWKFIARVKFVSINPSDYEKIFSTHCLSMNDEKNNDINSELINFFKKLKPLVEQKKQFIENFISDVRFGKDDKLIAKTFIDLMTDDDPEIFQRDSSIEHILPQDPQKWELSRKDTKDFVNKIGNLTLLFGDYNRENSNETMYTKEKIFKKSHFKLNQEIATKWKNIFEDDFKKAIVRRSKHIAERIEIIWQI